MKRVQRNKHLFPLQWWVGYLPGSNLLSCEGDYFQEIRGWSPHDDRSWGSYCLVVGPFENKGEAIRSDSPQEVTP